MHRGSGTTGRAVATFLAITAAMPAVQWCRYTWADIPLQCVAGYAVETTVGCPADIPAHAAPAALTADATQSDAADECGTASGCKEAGGCPFASADAGCSRADEACSARADAPASSGPTRDPHAHSGRAWCPQGRQGGPTASALRLVPRVVAAILPEPAITPDTFGLHWQRADLLAFARPPTREPDRTPPVRAPPSS